MNRELKITNGISLFIPRNDSKETPFHATYKITMVYSGANPKVDGAKPKVDGAKPMIERSKTTGTDESLTNGRR